MDRNTTLARKFYPADYGSQFGGHCGVLATAICAGITFEKAWEELRTIKRRPGNWAGGTRWLEREDVLTKLGVDFEAWDYKEEWRLDLWSAKPSDRKRCTLQTLCRDQLKPGKTYMVRVTGHVVTVRDGIVIDQTAAAPAAQHWARRKYVKRVTEIVS